MKVDLLCYWPLSTLTYCLMWSRGSWWGWVSVFGPTVETTPKTLCCWVTVKRSRVP